VAPLSSILTARTFGLTECSIKAIVNQIRVPVGEIDDLLDLAAWYASSRVTVLVNENGGWRNFKNIISTGMESSKLTQLDQSITMSQFERTIQVNPDQLTHQLRPEL